MTPDWQLPVGVDRGLWDYLHATEMVADYESQIGDNPLATADVKICERVFDKPGALIDLGCGTGRLARHFATRGFRVTGVDLSDAMLAEARKLPNGKDVNWVNTNLVSLEPFDPASFDWAACLFSTLGMVRGRANRLTALTSISRVLRPGGKLVLHAHNRYYAGLGTRRVLRQRLLTAFGQSSAGDITMPQSYGGATLTLHHFTRDELQHALNAAGFHVDEMLTVDDAGRVGQGSYGFVAVATRV